MAVMGVAKFERFFRTVADLDVDKNDLKRYEEFVHRKIHDLLVVAVATAHADARDIVGPTDLPITKGLQSCIHEFGRVDEEIELRALLDDLARRPPLELALSVDTEARLPEIAGGLSVALGRAFRILEPKLENPQTQHWERSFALFDLLV
jgi:uncharacterized protein DUF1931